MNKALSFIGIFSAKPTSKLYMTAVAREKSGFLKTAGYLLATLNAFIFLAYLNSINSYASSGYELKKMQYRIEELAEQNRKLDMAVAEKSSVGAIQEDFLSRQFVSAGTAQFIEVAPSFTSAPSVNRN